MQHTKQLFDRVLKVLPVENQQGFHNDLDSLMRRIEDYFYLQQVQDSQAKEALDSIIITVLRPHLTIGTNDNILQWAIAEIKNSLKNDLLAISFMPGIFLFK